MSRQGRQACLMGVGLAEPDGTSTSMSSLSSSVEAPSSGPNSASQLPVTDSACSVQRVCCQPMPSSQLGRLPSPSGTCRATASHYPRFRGFALREHWTVRSVLSSRAIATNQLFKVTTSSSTPVPDCIFCRVVLLGKPTRHRADASSPSTVATLREKFTREPTRLPE